MKVDEQMIKGVLQVLAGGGHCAYARASGGLILSDNEGGWRHNRIDIPTFGELKDKGLITMTRSMEQGHSVFHGPVAIYGITDSGREYLGKTSQP